MIIFGLSNNSPFEMKGGYVSTDGGTFRRRFTVPLDILPYCNDSFVFELLQELGIFLDKDQCAGLKSLLDNDDGSGGSQLPPKRLKQEPLEWSVDVFLNISIGTTNDKVFVRLMGVKARSRDFLLKLGSFFVENYKQDIHLKIELSLENPGGGVVEFTGKGSIEGLRKGVLMDAGASVNRFQESDFQNLKGKISIAVMESSSNRTDVGLFSKTRGVVSMNRKILEDTEHCDVKIVASDGEEIKCHKMFLCAGSPVLQAMLKDGKFKESNTSTIEMDDMTSASVKAFLDYLYYEGVEKANEDSTVALDLFKAAHKYNVPGLEECVKLILLVKPMSWFKPEVALPLYLFARNISDGNGLKKRAGQLLKLNHSEMKCLPDFKKLFEDHPEVALELWSYTCSL